MCRNIYTKVYIYIYIHACTSVYIYIYISHQRLQAHVLLKAFEASELNLSVLKTTWRISYQALEALM